MCASSGIHVDPSALVNIIKREALNAVGRSTIS